MSKTEIITTGVVTGLQALAPFLTALVNKSNGSGSTEDDASVRKLKRQIRSLKAEVKELTQENDNHEELLTAIVEEFPEVAEFIKEELEKIN